MLNTPLPFLPSLSPPLASPLLPLAWPCKFQLRQGPVSSDKLLSDRTRLASRDTLAAGGALFRVGSARLLGQCVCLYHQYLTSNKADIVPRWHLYANVMGMPLACLLHTVEERTASSTPPRFPFFQAAVRREEQRLDGPFSAETADIWVLIGECIMIFWPLPMFAAMAYFRRAAAISNYSFKNRIRASLTDER